MPVHADLPMIVQKFGIRVVAAILNVTPSAVSQWHKVPLSRVVILAKALQVMPAEIRPDLFAPETTVEEAACYQLQHDPRSRAQATLHVREKFKGETVTIRRVEWQEIKTLARATDQIHRGAGTKKSLRHQGCKSRKTVYGTKG
ncbi:helix-turn-helix domain-containing protein [Acidithiobacillus ferrivorans]|uniref:CI repressor n=1 Tax=mine drainage metagenome TaxID=410659 RepID=E6QGK8_9ZZZZ|nr:helix-turn-helix domain-containing protein [Acidithiobacillus ferrivorans]